jgi:hypothetical protein
MNLEQLVKETVAKVVAEKHLTPAEIKKKEEIVKAMKATFKGPAPAMYAIATKKAEKLAEDDLNEDYEVAMAQDSLDSIIRAAMMLKSELGDQEVNIPAWVQDHITNSENYINQAAKGYHESDAQIANHAGEEDESMYEARFKKGEDVGSKGFEFKDIAKKAAKQYGSKEAGQRVAGAIMKKVLNKEGEVDEVFKPKSSFDDYKIGDNVTVAGKKAKITNMKMDDESGERRARVRFEDDSVKDVNINSLDETRDPNSESDTSYYAVFDVHSKQPHYIIAKSASEMLSRLNGYIKAKAETNPEYKFSYDMEDLQDDYYNGKLMPHVISDDFASVTKNAEEFKKDFSYYPNAIEYKDSKESQELAESKESDNDKIEKYEKYTYTLDGDIVKPEITFLNNILKAMLGKKIYNIGAPENGKIELTPESGKKGTYTESQELDEYTVRRWQHYAGIK